MYIGIVSLKGDLRPKTHHRFYDIILIILWKKSFVQSFVVFCSVITKLWSYKVLNLMWVTSYLWMYNTIYPWFSLHIFVNFMKKEPFTLFYGYFDFSYEFMKLWSFEWLNWQWHHTNKIIICWLWLTCKFLGVLVDTILFYHEKVSFWAKVITLASGPL